MADIELMNAVRETVALVLGLAPDELPENAGMENVSAWTSLQHLAVVGAIEERFGIQMEMDEMTSASTVATLADVVAVHGGKA